MNKDLQATHQILALIEKSKSFSDEILDRMGGVFLNIDSQGKILRGNIEFARLLQVPHEELLGLHLSDYLSAESWQSFLSQMATVQSRQKPAVEFETQLQIKEQTKTFIWQLNLLEISDHSKLDNVIFNCMGRDISELLAAHQKVVAFSKDLEVVETVQKLFLPPQKSFIHSKVRVASSFLPAQISSGDYWWYEFTTPEKLWVFVGDVTGHGPGPAMVTALISGCFSALRFAETSRKNPLDFHFVFEAVHNNLRHLPDTPYWLTFTALEVDLKSRKVRWWGAAAPPLQLVTSQGDVKTVHLGRSSPLGSFEFQVSHGELDASPGDRLLMMTDGIFEMMNQEGRILGERGARTLLKGFTPEFTAESICQEVEDRLKKWRGDLPPADDATIVVIELL